VSGRYYFVEHDTHNRPVVPAYPGPTPLSSQRWWDKNYLLEQPALGELLSHRQTWDAGAPPLPLPLPVLVGTPDCIENGDSILDGLLPADPRRSGSFPIACLPVRQPIADFDWAADVYTCEVQSWWADRALELSNFDWGTLKAALEQRFPGAHVRLWLGERFFPQMVTIRHPSYLIVQFAETQTSEQALIQVIEGIQGPQQVGGFGSTLVWYLQAQRGLQALSAEGGGETEPLLCVGYSYGGAAAWCAAGIARMGRPTRHIRVLTFGAPRPGGYDLARHIGLKTRGVALANDNDAVTAVPPDLFTIIPAQIVLAVDLTPFAEWVPPRETWLQRADGTIRKNEYPQLSTAEIVELLQHVWTTHTLFGYPGHNIREYRRRIRLRCPGTPALADGAVGLGIVNLGGIGLQAPPAHQAKGIGLEALGVATGRIGLQAGLHPPSLLLGLAAPKMARIGSALGLKTPVFKGSLGLKFAPPYANGVMIADFSVSVPVSIPFSLPLPDPGLQMLPGSLLVFCSGSNIFAGNPSITYTDASGTQTLSIVLTGYGLNPWSSLVFLAPQIGGGPGTLTFSFFMPTDFIFLAVNVVGVNGSVGSANYSGSNSVPSASPPFSVPTLTPNCVVACSFLVMPGSATAPIQAPFKLLGYNDSVSTSALSPLVALMYFQQVSALGAGSYVTPYSSFTPTAGLQWALSMVELY
jgi:hypothetical protein